MEGWGTCQSLPLTQFGLTFTGRGSRGTCILRLGKVREMVFLNNFLKYLRLIIIFNQNQRNCHVAIPYYDPEWRKFLYREYRILKSVRPLPLLEWIKPHGRKKILSGTCKFLCTTIKKKYTKTFFETELFPSKDTVFSRITLVREEAFLLVAIRSRRFVTKQL